MRTIKNTAYPAYVREGSGQERFTMYTGTAAMTEPTVTQSPPPWDGSAEGYGPNQWDYGLFYKRQAPLSGCRCGMGAANPAEVGLTQSAMLFFGALALGAYMFFKPAKTKRRRKLSRRRRRRRNGPPTVSKMLSQIRRTGRLPRGSY